MQKTPVQFLDWEDPLEEEMATHSSILACLGNPMDRGAWGATVHGVTKESDKTELICHVTLFFYWFPLDYTPLVCAVHFSFSVIFIPVSLADTYGNEDV